MHKIVYKEVYKIIYKIASKKAVIVKRVVRVSEI